MLCITVAKDDKWANVIASKVIGVSKHIDFALFHWKASDVKALKLPLTKFIYVNAAGVVDEVILADQLKTRGINFKTAKRDSHPLTDEEQWEIEAAIELVRTGAAPKTDAAMAGQAEAGKAVEENEPATANVSVAQGDGTAAESTISQSEGDAGGMSSAADDEAQDVSTSSALALVKPTRIAHHKKRR